MRWGGLSGESAAALVRAAPVQWPVSSGGNDHFYEFVAAQESSGPTPQTRGSGSTNVQRTERLPGDIDLGRRRQLRRYELRLPLYIEAWAGGIQTPFNNPSPADGWGWITGESWSFTDWAVGEPNDTGGPEYLLSIGGDLNQPQFQRKWNDDELGTNQQLKTGYLVEYPVPEPPLAAAILVIAIFYGGRRRSTTKPCSWDRCHDGLLIPNRWLSALAGKVCEVRLQNLRARTPNRCPECGKVSNTVTAPS